tara:strand:+ start:102 stop:566 length:465 start_codon:yes stop_codon:yes gene_type:complete
VGDRRYSEFTSPEGEIYKSIVDMLKNDEDLNRIKWYFYDYDNDEDVEDEVPPPGKVPALMIRASDQTRVEYSTDREDAVLGLDVISWIDGNHVEDAWGVRNSVYRALMLYRVPSVFSAPWVMGVTPGVIEQISRGLMRSEQTAQISYFIEHPRR